jgi:hypothetical protein
MRLSARDRGVPVCQAGSYSYVADFYVHTVHRCSASWHSPRDETKSNEVTVAAGCFRVTVRAGLWRCAYGWSRVMILNLEHS